MNPRHGGGGGRKFETAKDFKKSFKTLLNYLSKYKFKILISVVFAIFSTVFTIVGPKIMMKITDEIVKGVIAKYKGVADGMDFSYIFKIVVVLIVLYLVSALFNFIQAFIMSNMTTEAISDLRAKMMKKIHNLPLGYFHKYSYGDVLSRVTNDLDTLNNSLNQVITQSVTALTSLIGIVIMMCSISIKLTLVSMVMLPVIFLLIYLVVKYSQKYFISQQAVLGELNSKTEESYGGYAVLKAFNREDMAIENFDKSNDLLYEVGWKAQFFSGIMMPIINTITNFGYVAVCFIGAIMISNNQMSIGGIQAFMQYVRNFTQPINQLGNIASQIQITLASSERIFEFLEEDEEIKYETVKSTDNIKGSIDFNDVHFSYDGTDENIIIKNFSTSVDAGQKVAIVGPTGAGKTTLVNLLMGFYPLNSGDIKLDDISITDMSREELRKQFAIVLQDTWTFKGTIMENIRYGNLDASDEDVFRVAKAAEADHFISTLPNGYDTVLDEDSTNISQGEKQLLTIARAMLRNPKVLILDEATSNVDTRTEVLIQDAMEKLTSKRTSFIIAHRLSTIRNADLILVLNDGNIVEQGSHDELIKYKGFYYNLYNSQFA